MKREEEILRKTDNQRNRKKEEYWEKRKTESQRKKSENRGYKKRKRDKNLLDIERASEEREREQL